MRADAILLPFAAVLLLTLAVWLRLYFTRIPELRRQRISPQRLATRAEKSSLHLSDAEARASDNFQNLFELPVIFYALCLAIYTTGATDGVYLVLAWAFTALRFAHSAVHLFYNNVLHRFIAYLVAGVALFAMAIRFAISLL